MDELLLGWTTLNLFFQNLGNWLVAPMRALSYLGQQEFVMLLLPAIYWCWDSTLGFRLGAILLLSNGVNAILKLVFHSPRPYWISAKVKALSVETSFGLPSGHAQNAAALWGRLAVAVWQKWAKWIFVIIIGLIGLSRVYLGMHFLSDVAAGWLIGGLLVWLVVRLEGPISGWLGRKSVAVQVLWAFIAAGVVILLGLLTRLALGSWQVPELWRANALLQNPNDPITPLSLEGLFTVAGTWWGMAFGYAWFTRKFSHFNAKGAWEKRALRFALGLVVLVILWYGLGMIFPKTEDILGYGLRFLRYALMGGWVSAGGPWLFLRLKLADPAQSLVKSN